VGEDRGLRRAVYLARRLHLGHHRGGDAEQPQQLLVPLQRMDVEEHRARGVAHVRHVHLAAREAPDEPRVDGAEHQFALLGPLSRPRHVVQNPFDLRGAEIGVDDQPRPFPDEFGLPLGLQPVAVLRGAAILPDDGVVDRFFGLRIPHDRGLPLVGDADARDVQAVDVDGRDRLGDHRSLRRPYLVRVVFHPSRLGEYLRELPLCHRAYLPFPVEYDRTGTARPLIQ
jgi:hypothetical protein